MTCPGCGAESDDSVDVCFTCGKAFVASPNRITRGTVVAGRYEILSHLGKGGMGMVYKAHDRVLDETVALKTLRADVAQEPEVARRFISETKLARLVRHQNVCAIHEYGEAEGLRYIAMEYIDGIDLRRVLRECGILPVREGFDITIEIARGLQAIHEAGVIHRDLKTTNIMRDRVGLVRLMDFGIAKASGSDVTLGGQVVGTPEYMSPEQARGLKVDFRSDIYTLGVVIYEIFTGRVPFRGDTPIATILMHLHDPVPLEGDVAQRIPMPLLPILARAMAKDPAERFASTRELVKALEAARAEAALDPSFHEMTASPLEALVEPDPTIVNLTVDTPPPISIRASATAAAAAPTPVPTAAAPVSARAGANDRATAVLLNEPRGSTVVLPAPPRRRPRHAARAAWGAGMMLSIAGALAATRWARSPAPPGESEAITAASGVPSSGPVGAATSVSTSASSAGAPPQKKEAPEKSASPATLRPANAKVASASPSMIGTAETTASKPKSPSLVTPRERAGAPAPVAVSPRPSTMDSRAIAESAPSLAEPAPPVAPTPVPEEKAAVHAEPTVRPAPVRAAEPDPVALPPNAVPPAPHPTNQLPEYPRELLEHGVAGQVYLKLTVTARGEVSEVGVLSGDEPFAHIAADAARGWRYSPALVDGQATAVYIIIKVPFRPPPKKR
jgi:eukaryotic-like serine/threonine-protein kinase